MPALLAPSRARRAAPVALRQGTTPPRRWVLTPLAAVASALVAMVIAVTALVATGADWRSLVSLSAPASSASLAPVVREAVLAIPTRGEMALARARRLAGSGELHDALTALDLVRATDPQRADADALRSEIQRQLLRLEHP
jgi:hypothetical protein